VSVSIALGPLTPRFLRPRKIKRFFMPNKILKYCKTMLQEIGLSESPFKKKRLIIERKASEWSLKSSVVQMCSPSYQRKRDYAALNSDNVGLIETPRIDPITILIPILFWIILFIELCLRS
jgi:hypothetical protein